MYKYFCCCKKRINDYYINKTLLAKVEDECSLCLQPLKNYDCIKTENCNHVFHYECYKTYITEFKKNIKIENIKCPYCYSTQTNLNNFIIL